MAPSPGAQLASCESGGCGVLRLVPVLLVLASRWLNLSPSAKDFLMGMLRYNTAHRLTAQQVAPPSPRGAPVPLCVRQVRAPCVSSMARAVSKYIQCRLKLPPCMLQARS